MKSKALYHLLLDRARHIRIHDNADVSNFITSIERSLSVDFDKGVYTIAWAHNGHAHAFGMTNEDFHFYIRGDLGKPPTMRDIRRGNWDAALAVWQRMAQMSGQNWPAVIEDSSQSMGLDIAPKTDITPLIKRFAIVAGVVFVIGLLFNGIPGAFAAAIGGTSLAVLSHLRDGLRRAPWPEKINDWIIAVPAAILPAFFPHDGLLALACIVALIMTANIVELIRAQSRQHWIVIGAGIGLLAAATESAGLSWGLVTFAILTAIVTIVIPPRADQKGVFAMCGLIALGALVIWPDAPELTLDPSIWLLVVVFALITGLGWFIGEMFTLMPWLIHALLGFVALASGILGDADMAGAVMIAGGFAFAETVRLVTAFRGTRAAPIIRHGDAA